MKFSAVAPFIVFGLFAVVIGASLFNPNITGYVPANIFTQNLNIDINESQDFLLTSDSKSPFIVTSLRISGNISGNGVVKVYLDAGKGQTALIYENIQKKRENKGFTPVTGRPIESHDDQAESEKDEKNITLVIKPLKNPLKKEELDYSANGSKTIKGDFVNKCLETCAIYMQLSKDTVYRLAVLVEEGTTLRIDSIVYQVKED